MSRKRAISEENTEECNSENETMDTHEILRQSFRVPMSKAVAKRKKKRVYTTKIYKCDACGKQTEDRSVHLNHILIHSDEKAYQCTQCPNNFKTKKYLARHVNRVHTDSKKLECDQCGKKFLFNTQLKSHMMIHTGEKPLKCEVCGKGFRVHYSLKTHMLIHSNEKPYRCSFCDYSCRDNSTLRKHQNRHMDLDRSYQCRSCLVVLRSKYRLKVHIAEHHLGLDVRIYKCDICGKGYKVKSVLAKHIQVIHSRPPAPPPDSDDDDYKPKKKRIRKLRLPCEVCGRVFDRRVRYEQHIRRHKPSTSVKCEYCHMCFVDASYLSVHLRRAHNAATFECAACAHVCVSRSDMREHLRVQHSEGDEFSGESGAAGDSASCAQCGRRCRSATQLARHVASRHAPATSSSIPDLEVTVKQEPLETEDAFAELDLFEVDKQEDDDRVRSAALSTARAEIARQLGSLRRVPEAVFDDYFIDTVNKREATGREPVLKVSYEKTEETINGAVNHEQSQPLPEEVTAEIPEEDIPKPKKKRKSSPTDKKAKKKKKKKIKRKQLPATDAGAEQKRSFKKISLNIDLQQCYVCFKVFKTKPELLEHCQEHFDVCHERTLKKCPLCEFVTKGDLRRHIHLIHRLDVPMLAHKLKDNSDCAAGSRYTYTLNTDAVKEIEVIPSIKRLNNLAAMKLDRQKRELKDRTVTKTKLVKKGKEWIVEKEAIDVSGKLPKFNDEEYIQAGVCESDSYIQKLKKLYQHSKKNNRDMMFPCDTCQKVCRTVSGLVLHRRRHDPNSKPFKPKIWKHKLSKKDLEELNEKTKKKIQPKTVDTNKPRPILSSKHRCDPKLKDFYMNNIRGGDIEFWQFLKIFNKIARDNVNDFTDLENKDEYAMHRVLHPNDTVNTQSVPIEVVKPIEPIMEIKKPKLEPKGKFTRVVRLSKKEYLRREELKEKLREKIKAEMEVEITLQDT